MTLPSHSTIALWNLYYLSSHDQVTQHFTSGEKKKGYFSKRQLITTAHQESSLLQHEASWRHILQVTSHNGILNNQLFTWHLCPSGKTINYSSMKDRKWNGSFVHASKTEFNNEPFFLSRAVSLCKVLNSCSQASQVVGFRFHLSCTKPEVCSRVGTKPFATNTEL